MYNSTTILLLVFLFQDLIAWKNYTNSQIWQICDKNRNFLNHMIESNELDVWKRNKTCMDVLINDHDVKKLKKFLNNRRIHHNVLIKNLQNLIDQENSRRLKISGSNFTWNRHYHIHEIYKFLTKIKVWAKKHIIPEPSVLIKIIGETFEKRKIKVLELEDKSDDIDYKRLKIMIGNSFHGSGRVSTAAVTYTIDKIIKDYMTNPVFSQADWYFLPVTNPDGYDFTFTEDRFWRKNRKPFIKETIKDLCFGVDLNRNFGFKWGGKGSTGNECTQRFRGYKPFSEEETLAIRDYVNKKSFDFDVYISFHSYGQSILYPFGYADHLGSNWIELKNIAAKIAKNISSYNERTYAIGSSFSYSAASGSMEDWLYGIMGVKYVFQILLKNTGLYSIDLPDERVQPAIEEGFYIMYGIVQEIIKIREKQLLKP